MISKVLPPPPESLSDPECSAVVTKKRRLEFIDLAKGICIILVVFVHCKCEYVYDSQMLTLLRMPLYFVLSGMFFKDYGGYIISIEKKVNKLVIPFVAFYIIADLLYWGAYHVGLLSVELVKTPIEGLFMGRGSKVNPPIWFLVALFDLYIIFLLVFRLVKNFNLRVTVLVGLSFLGIVLSYYRISLPLFFSQSLFALPFFCYGYILKQSEILSNRKLVSIPYMFWAIVPAIVYLICEWCDVNVIFAEYSFSGNLLIIHLCSIAMVVSVLFLCRGIRQLPFISYVGRYSIVVLCLHWMVITMCLFAWEIFFDEMEFPRWLLSICVVGISAALIWPCVKFIPHLVAQKDLTVAIKSRLRRMRGQEVETT